MQPIRCPHNFPDLQNSSYLRGAKLKFVILKISRGFTNSNTSRNLSGIQREIIVRR
jgi:hypothetical protein